MRRMLGVLAMVGCARIDAELPSEVGVVRLCLTTDQVAPPAATATEGDAEHFVVSGTVTEAGVHPGPLASSVQPCWGAADGGRSLTFTDGADVPWRLSWLATEAESDRSPEVALVPGDPLTLTFVRDIGFAGDAAVVVRDGGDVPVFAAEEGLAASVRFGEASLLTEVDVRRGSSTGRFLRTGCGAVVTDAMIFRTGGETLVLDTWVEGTLRVAGRSLQARNPGAFEYVGDIDCTDTWGPAPWLLYAPLAP